MEDHVIEQGLILIKEHNNPSASLLQVKMGISLEDAEQIVRIYEHNAASSHCAISTSINSYNIKSTFDMDSLDGHGFEYYCADILYYNHFSNVQVTSGSGDFGVDILCTKDSLSYAIQCKCYQHNVGNKAVQEVVSGKIYYKCTNAIVMTNSYFTNAAQETARLTDVELWDRGRIRELHRIAIGNGYTPHSY